MNGGARVTVDGASKPERSTDAPIVPFRAPAAGPRADAALGCRERHRVGNEIYA
jgi:hypothetical protein